MNTPQKIHRRRFLRETPILGVTLAAAAPLATAQSGTRGTGGEYFRVGFLNVSSYSHLSLWAPLINPRKGGKDTPFTGMRITHCWEIDPAKAEEFANIYGCEKVRNFDDMVGKVDGIISGGYYNHAWNHILHQPYLEAGLPNLINRPFANSLAKARKMIETAKKYKATILAPSAHEYNEAIARGRVWAAGKKILCYNATNSFDDYPSHGVHGVYMISRAIAEAGNPVVSVSYQARSWHSPPGVLTFEHADQQGRRFLGTLHQVAGSWGTMEIHTPEEYGGRDFLIQPGKEYPFDKTEVWAPTIWAFQSMAMNGAMPQSFEQIHQKTNVFLAGWKSILENEGKPVRLADVPEAWESPVDLPNHPGDPTVAMFVKKFGK